jgi:putative copper export protein
MRRSVIVLTDRPYDASQCMKRWRLYAALAVAVTWVAGYAMVLALGSFSTAFAAANQALLLIASWLIGTEVERHRKNGRRDPK